MHVLDGDLVLGDRAMVLRGGVGDPALSLEGGDHVRDVLVTGPAQAFGGTQLVFFGGLQAVEVGLHRGVRPVDFGDGVAEVEHDVAFLLGEDRPIAGQQQFGVADGGVSTAEAEGNRELGTHLPFLEPAAQQITPGVVELAPAHPLVHQVFPVASPAVQADGIEPGEGEVAGSEDFQFAALDEPLLATEFGATGERFGEGHAPVEADRDDFGLFGGPKQATIGDGETQHQAEATFGDLHTGGAAEDTTRGPAVGAGPLDELAREGVLDFLLEAEVLLFDLGDLGAVDILAGLESFPGGEGAVAGFFAGVEIVIGEVEIPVGVLDVADEVADTQLEVGHRLVGVDPGQQHAAGKPGRPVGAVDPVEVDATSLQQGLADNRLDVGVPHRGEFVPGRVVGVVLGVVPHRELGTSRGPLAQAGDEAGEVLLQDAGTTASEHVVDGPVVVLHQGGGTELGIELAEGRVDTEPRIGLGDGGILDRADRQGGPQDLASQVPHHLGPGKCHFDRLLEREVPVFGLPLIGDRDGLHGRSQAVWILSLDIGFVNVDARWNLGDLSFNGLIGGFADPRSPASLC